MKGLTPLEITSTVLNKSSYKPKYILFLYVFMLLFLGVRVLSLTGLTCLFLFIIMEAMSLLCANARAIQKSDRKYV